MSSYRSATVVGLALAIAWMSTAATRAAGYPHGGVSLSPRRLEGRVVSVDAQGGSVTVDERGKQTTLEVPPRASVVRDGMNVPLSEVQPGDEVRASFLADDFTRKQPWQLEVWSRGRGETR